ncbi:MAG TPA: PPC domain-containing protein, partial [Bdellovibrionales bacterium]|nr:PPC domain-containing protein [Bdellovibrionales bacterium]
PSAALIKGILMHTATDLFPGQFGTGPKQELPTARPNNHEGFGRVDVAKATSVESSQLKDEQVGVGTGEAKTFDVKVNGGKKLVVTLTYTDAPGSAAAAKALVNDLDLSIVGPNGKVYEIGDRTNNNELIEIANPALGQYKVSVKGVKVPSGKNGKQPFAVVMGLL